jgi:hypothetical protein
MNSHKTSTFQLELSRFFSPKTTFKSTTVFVIPVKDHDHLQGLGPVGPTVPIKVCLLIYLLIGRQITFWLFLCDIFSPILKADWFQKTHCSGLNLLLFHVSLRTALCDGTRVATSLWNHLSLSLRIIFSLSFVSIWRYILILFSLFYNTNYFSQTLVFPEQHSTSACRTDSFLTFYTCRHIFQHLIAHQTLRRAYYWKVVHVYACVCKHIGFHKICWSYSPYIFMLLHLQQYNLFCNNHPLHINIKINNILASTIKYINFKSTISNKYKETWRTSRKRQLTKKTQRRLMRWQTRSISCWQLNEMHVNIKCRNIS